MVADDQNRSRTTLKKKKPNWNAMLCSNSDHRVTEAQKLCCVLLMITYLKRAISRTAEVSLTFHFKAKITQSMYLPIQSTAV